MSRASEKQKSTVALPSLTVGGEKMEDWFSTYEDGDPLRHPYKEPVGSRQQVSSAGVWAAVAM